MESFERKIPGIVTYQAIPNTAGKGKRIPRSPTIMPGREKLNLVFRVGAAYCLRKIVSSNRKS